MSAIGFAVTKLTSQFGLLSRKASIRLATQTGKKLVDKTNQVGRALNKTEIEEVFTETLPRRCRPKLYTTADELFAESEKLSRNKEDLTECLISADALNIPSPMGRPKMFVPVDKLSKENICGDIAHELEHGLENNGFLLKDFFKTLILSPRILYKFIMNKGQIADYAKTLEKFSHDLESRIIYDISLGRTGKDSLRQTVRSFLDPKNLETAEDSYIAALFLFDKEIRAYKAGSAIEQYIKSGTNLQQKERFETYQKVQNILKEELKLFKNNKKSGILAKPLKYEYDKDFSRLLPDEEDRKFIMSLVQKPQDLEWIYYRLTLNGTNVGALRKFLGENGLTIRKDVNIGILGVDADVLKRDNIMQILKDMRILIE